MKNWLIFFNVDQTERELKGGLHRVAIIFFLCVFKTCFVYFFLVCIICDLSRVYPHFRLQPPATLNWMSEREWIDQA